jgi:hypothetical protein
MQSSQKIRESHKNLGYSPATIQSDINAIPIQEIKQLVRENSISSSKAEQLLKKSC